MKESLSLPFDHFRFTPHSVADFESWKALRADPSHASLWARIEKICASAPDRPPAPSATDFLAARRSNDRARLDRHWGRDRAVFFALALRRCVLGLDERDLDDRLLDWTWSFLTESSWTVSAHLPKNDLPLLGKSELDLASCEMAGQLAELRECLKPWMDSVSGTLADSLVYALDERVLTPYGNGLEVWWQDAKRKTLNNWLGVCAGSILAACESLAAQGHPRPKARERALAGLRLFLEKSFTAHGECDEGLGYWNYGVGMACLGWSRLTREEFERSVDLERLRQVAGYPRRAHLFANAFFSGNDGGLTAAAPLYFVPWLAAASGDEFLNRWARESPDAGSSGFGQSLRILAASDFEMRNADGGLKGPAEKAPAPTPAHPKTALSIPQFLDDQQVAILRAPTPKGELLACLTGGHNAERHNHNDLGHFMVALDGKFILPDLGAPEYKADFFGPKRYTYLAASSRGHSCPVIGEFEQCPGESAAAQVLAWSPQAEIPRLVLDLTTAYPPEAGLKAWIRSLECWPGPASSQGAPQSARMVLTDVFRTEAPRHKITHVLWSLEGVKEPEEQVEGGGFRLRLGDLLCEISPAPHALSPTRFAPEDLGLRDFAGRALFRIEAVYRTDEKGSLKVETRFYV